MNNGKAITPNPAYKKNARVHDTFIVGTNVWLAIYPNNKNMHSIILNPLGGRTCGK